MHALFRRASELTPDTIGAAIEVYNWSVPTEDTKATERPSPLRSLSLLLFNNFSPVILPMPKSFLISS